MTREQIKVDIINHAIINGFHELAREMKKIPLSDRCTGDEQPYLFFDRWFTWSHYNGAGDFADVLSGKCQGESRKLIIARRRMFINALRSIVSSYYPDDEGCVQMLEAVRKSPLYVLPSYEKEGAYSYCNGDKYNLGSRIFTTFPKIVKRRLGVTSIKDHVLGDIVQRLNALIKNGGKMAERELIKFKMYKGPQIKKLYRSFENTDLTSCMTHKGNDITLYTENPDSFELLVGYCKEKAISRSIVFTNVEGGKVLGRIYTTGYIRDNNNKEWRISDLVTTHAKAQGWSVRGENKQIEVRANPTKSGGYPYMDSFQYARRDGSTLLLRNTEGEQQELLFQSTSNTYSWLRSAPCNHCSNVTSVTPYRPDNNIMNVVLSCVPCKKEHYCTCKHCGALTAKGNESYEKMQICVKNGKTFTIEEHEYCSSCKAEATSNMKEHECGHWSTQSGKQCGKCKLEDQLRKAAANPSALPVYTGELSEGERGCECDLCKEDRIETARTNAVDGVYQCDAGNIWRI